MEMRSRCDRDAMRSRLGSDACIVRLRQTFLGFVKLPKLTDAGEEGMTNRQWQPSLLAASTDCVQAGAGADWAGGGVGRARGRCTPVPPATSLRGARVRGRVWRGPGRPGCPLSTATTFRALWAGRWAERERGGRSSYSRAEL